MSDPCWEALSTQGKVWVEGAYSSFVSPVYLNRAMRPPTCVVPRAEPTCSLYLSLGIDRHKCGTRSGIG